MSINGLRRSFAALLGIGAISLSGAAHAQNPCFPGAQPGAVNLASIFTINAGGTIVFTGPQAATVSVNGGITNWVLLGINKIGIVDLGGNPIANALGAGGSTVVPAHGAPASWSPCGTSFYEDVSTGAGFPDNIMGTNWLRVASQSVLSSYGVGANNEPNQGTFDFSGTGGIVGKTFGTDYLLGIDFLAGNPGSQATTTGRIFFGPTSGGTNGGGGQTGTGGNVPEPGEWAAMGILSAGLLGLMARSRRRRA